MVRGRNGGGLGESHLRQDVGRGGLEARKGFVGEAWCGGKRSKEVE